MYCVPYVDSFSFVRLRPVYCVPYVDSFSFVRPRPVYCVPEAMITDVPQESAPAAPDMGGMGGMM